MLDKGSLHCIDSDLARTEASRRSDRSKMMWRLFQVKHIRIYSLAKIKPKPESSTNRRRAEASVSAVVPCGALAMVVARWKLLVEHFVEGVAKHSCT